MSLWKEYSFKLVVAQTVFRVGCKTSWYLEGTWKERLVAYKGLWHLALEKKCMLEAPRVLECNLHWRLWGAWEGKFVSARSLAPCSCEGGFSLLICTSWFALVKVWSPHQRTWWTKGEDATTWKPLEKFICVLSPLFIHMCLYSFYYHLFVHFLKYYKVLGNFTKHMVWLVHENN